MGIRSGMWKLSEAAQAVQNQNWTGLSPADVEVLVVAGGGGGGTRGGASCDGIRRGFRAVPPR